MKPITLGIDNNFLAIDREFSEFDRAKVTILPVAYEHTVSYGKGASLGPDAILKASHQVEFYDEEFDRELCFDVGISTLKPFDLSGKIGGDAIWAVAAFAGNLLDAGKFLVTLGGEHTISIATIISHYKKHPAMSILHFDAHSDLRQIYDGDPFSHACFMARVAEFFPPERITQVGIRAQCREEADYIRVNNVKTFYATAIRCGKHGTDWQRAVAETLSDETYVTFDVDYFDPSVMPATGTPEPGGFGYSETLDVFRSILLAGKKIIGFDVVELAPIAQLHFPDLTAARLVYKILNFAFDNYGKKND